MPSIKWNKHWALDLKRFIAHHKSGYYGSQWGDPSIEENGFREKPSCGQQVVLNLSKIIDIYIIPYLTDQTSAMEIGAGGGRWTQYLLAAKELTVVELNEEFFPYLSERFDAYADKLKFYLTTGFELDGISDDSIDYLFSFGTFVHLEPDTINAYLEQMKRVMKRNAVAIIHYSDKTKEFFQQQHVLDLNAFSDMNSKKMEQMVLEHHFKIIDHNNQLLDHSNIIAIRNDSDGQQ